MMWHVVFAEHGGLAQSRAARSRDSAIHVACELLSQSYDVRRIVEPNGSFIERPELEAHFDKGRFPGLQQQERMLSGRRPGAVVFGSEGLSHQTHSDFRFLEQSPDIEDALSRHIPGNQKFRLDHRLIGPAVRSVAELLLVLPRPPPIVRPDQQPLIPTILRLDACPGSPRDGIDALRVGDEEVPRLLAGCDDGLIAVPDKPAEFVAAQVVPDIFHWVEFWRVGR